ncbi:hypothetical protein SCORR_v1c03820 [Spiroplasma corruscae]|uniref:Lipoprotein n=1 Tax=Spiroplasma corruscae TaxID=216934 RepID=A0A222ENS4_9MOLU|nr:hypothetical protein [Spiroplasma corruscae]ASP28156.1 hypothetical protein SCORR_v1c03820 [Spiroplasma corruscae]
MKKLMNSLLVITILSTPLSTIISCDPSSTEDNNNKNNDDYMTNMQDEMLKGAEFMSRIVLSSRHENLNFNLNEILSMYLTPLPVMLNMPVSYKYNDQNINFLSYISKFRDVMSPSINKINGDNYSGMYASYIMGMYDDNFYNDFVKNEYFEDSFNEKGDTGFNKKDDKNELGILAGLNKKLNLSTDENRRNLSWGIQDTGALTNYLLSKGYDGAYPSGTSGISNTYSSANVTTGGTNSSGYSFYNSVLSTGKPNRVSISDYSKKTVNDKSKGFSFEPMKKTESTNILEDYSSKLNNMNFNGVGSLLTNTAGSLNLNGYINSFSSLKDSIGESDFGVDVLLQVANIITPLLADNSEKVNLLMQSTGFSLLYNVQNVINTIQNNTKLCTYLKGKGFNEDILNNKLDKKEIVNPISQYMKPDASKVRVSRFYNKENGDKNDPISTMKMTESFLRELKKCHENLDDNEKIFFTKSLFINPNSPFYESYKSIISNSLIGGIEVEGWTNLIGNDGSSGMNLLSLVADSYKELSKNETKDLILEIEKEYSGKTLKSITRSEKLKLFKKLGYDISSKKYTEDSFLSNYYKFMTDKKISGVNELNGFFDKLRDGVNNSMKNVHEKALQYIYDDKYWNTQDKKINVTDPSELNGEISFVLDYSGNGDKESNADQQTEKVNVPKNFNPYQTLVNYQDNYAKSESLKSKIDLTRISGVVLGKEQLNLSDEELISYDGKGVKYDKVNHKYKIIWKNVSNDVNKPYWVITGIQSFNSDNEEFYNIY